MQTARKFVTDDKIDLFIGWAATPLAIPIADVAAESSTVHFAASPIGLPPGKDAWSLHLPQSNDGMAHAVVGLMKTQGVKTIGTLGYTDADGEQWLKSIPAAGGKNSIKVIATERLRSDTGVTAQALKLVAANPDAMLVVASGAGAAMPEKPSSSAATRARCARPTQPPLRPRCASATRMSSAGLSSPVRPWWGICCRKTISARSGRKILWPSTTRPTAQAPPTSLPALRVTR